MVTIVDDENHEWLNQWKWHCTTYGYAGRKQGRKYILMHRLIMDVVDEGTDIEVDHINRNPLDNQKSNLRICNRTQNSMNKIKSNKNTKSKYKGVTSVTGHPNLWTAKLNVNYEQLYIGSFSSEEAAAMAYNIYAKRYHGEFAVLNDVNVTDWQSYSAEVNKTSKYNGVCWDSNREKWYVSLHVSDKNKFIGRFENELDAAYAFNEAVIHYGCNANLNEIPYNYIPNKKKIRKKSSKYRGVSFNKRDNRWSVSTNHNGKDMWIGIFNSEIEAAKAYNEFIIKNNLNKTLNIISDEPDEKQPQQ